MKLKQEILALLLLDFHSLSFIVVFKIHEYVF